MNYDEQVAHHEAAHVVLSRHNGGGPSDVGIDLNRPSSVEDAFGSAGVKLLAHDPSQPEDVQMLDLIRNLSTILAGAASDALILGWSQEEALTRQPGDVGYARELIERSPLFASAAPGAVAAFSQKLIDRGFEAAQQLLTQANIWKRVESIAIATLANGGELSQLEIENLLTLAED